MLSYSYLHSIPMLVSIFEVFIEKLFSTTHGQQGKDNIVSMPIYTIHMAYILYIWHLILRFSLRVVDRIL